MVVAEAPVTVTLLHLSEWRLQFPKYQLSASLRINSSKSVTWFPATRATTLLPFWLLDGSKLREKNNERESMTSSSLRDFRRTVFEASG